eukprot:CAMPEP_0179210240 /NCGR_PEP_ID=MMETSP0796-20121207/104857_1 /TAXON_ID=73915 /ORGANISM="Pyrodinium bahamense, Strain pbaha01" /LENGTH=138 /DNA_ID=CAMNT_0020915203 /DNA_START=37 /DNA_END=450 /DNA_ORIENTATION=+
MPWLCGQAWTHWSRDDVRVGILEPMVLAASALEALLCILLPGLTDSALLKRGLQFSVTTAASLCQELMSTERSKWLAQFTLHDPILRLLLRHSKPLRDEQSRPTSRNFMAYDRTGVSLQVLLCISLQPPTPSVRPKRP